MKNCPNCGGELYGDNIKDCPYCYVKIEKKASMNTDSQYNLMYRQQKENDGKNQELHEEGSGWNAFISFLYPIIGLLLCLIEQKNNWRAAERYKKWAIRGITFGIGAVIILLVVGSCSFL